MKPVTLVDTGPVVALLDRRDEYHEWAKARFRERRLPFLTCEAVITEAAYLVAQSGEDAEKVLGLMRSGALRLAYEMAPESEVLQGLLARYRNVPMDLADACLVRMNEREAGGEVLTLDGDFHIYRTESGEPIPSVLP